MTRLLPFALALLTGTAALGVPVDDGRVRTVGYAPGRVIDLETATGNTLTVIFDPGERISAVTVGLPQAFEVRVSQLGDSLFVRPLGEAPSTSMNVQTDRRSYEFRLISGPGSGAVYAVRLDYGDPAGEALPSAAPVADTSAPPSSYRITGFRNLRPSSVRDDGARTYIEWYPDQMLPAVFAKNALGQEAMVDGYMRDGVFTIDRVFSRLIFRIDKRKAEAERQAGRTKR